jgi:ssDNA-binding Zn-finger/Zn-ribbon topoisomerase 1
MASMLVSCPSCGASSGLKGKRDGDDIRVTCTACRHSWLRNPDRCPRCGEPAMAPVRAPLYEKARGVQQSIVAYRVIKQCTDCGFQLGSISEPNAT